MKNKIYSCIINCFFFVLISLVIIEGEDKLLKPDLINNIRDFNSLISSILFALFIAKLYFDKERRNQRKKKIIDLSEKVTLLREIALRICRDYSFWKNKNDIKARIDSRYKKLTYEEHCQLASNDYKKFKDAYGEDGKAYLALKGLAGDEVIVYGIEYTSEVISRYVSYVLTFVDFLESSDDSIVNFEKIFPENKKEIKEMYFKIMNKKIVESDFKKCIINLFLEFEDNIFGDVAKEIENYKTQPPFYLEGLISLVLSLVIFFALVFIELIDIVFLKYILVIFISNFFYFVKILCNTLLDELKIESIYD
jgi:hypothetical protein